MPDDQKGLPTRQVHAIGFTISSVIGEKRQIQFQDFLEDDEPDAVANARLDRITRLIERQAARYEREDLLGELDRHEKTLRQLTEDLARLDVEYETKQAERGVQIEEAAGEHKKLTDEAYNEHVTSGRRGPLVLRGNVRSRVEAADRVIGKIKEEIEKARAEREAHRANATISVNRFTEEVARLKAKIARCEELIRG